MKPQGIFIHPAEPSGIGFSEIFGYFGSKSYHSHVESLVVQVLDICSLFVSEPKLRRLSPFEICRTLKVTVDPQKRRTKLDDWPAPWRVAGGLLQLQRLRITVILELEKKSNDIRQPVMYNLVFATGNPWENHGILWWLNGISGVLPSGTD